MGTIWSKKFKDPSERFWSKVDASASCWVWTAATAGQGYGKFTLSSDGKSTYPYAHRHSWELLVGPIPDGMTLDHLCKNRKCVNPDHLEVVTQAVNCLRGESPPARNARKGRGA
jgi:hypothetical protein